jgi:hypothetical protein
MLEPKLEVMFEFWLVLLPQIDPDVVFQLVVLEQLGKPAKSDGDVKNCVLTLDSVGVLALVVDLSGDDPVDERNKFGGEFFLLTVDAGGIKIGDSNDGSP